MLPLLISVCVLSADPATSHESANPLYRELLEKGLLVGPDLRAKFPLPTLADGLDAAKQTEAIKALIGADYSYPEFTQRLVNAPQVLKLRDVRPSDPEAPARGVDVWFLAYGDFKATADEKALDRLVNASRGEGKSRQLTKEELAKRKIAPTPGAEDRESYGHVEFDFLEKVRVKVTGRAVWSRTAESVVAAAEIDPRFVGDSEYPSQWQSLAKTDTGTKAGPAKPWSGAGFYLKVTKLAAPAGALFVEQHVIFAEPRGWFEGANLLRSKLPPVVTNNVRKMRREWVNVSAGK